VFQPHHLAQLKMQGLDQTPAVAFRVSEKDPREVWIRCDAGNVDRKDSTSLQTMSAVA